MAQRHNIEDVLSSIRRLVATDPNAVPSPARRSDTMSGPTLVLDQTLRVTDPEDPFQMIRNLAQEERDGRDATHVAQDIPEGAADITGDIAATDDPAPILWREDEDTDPAPVAPFDPDIEDPRDLEFEFNDTAPKPEAPDEAAPTVNEDPAFDAASPDPAAEIAKWDASEDPSLAFEEVEPVTLLRPDVPIGYAEDTDFLAASIGASAIRVTQAAFENPELLQLSAQVESDEALRDLIAETVRQELAGDLGERITRNVRKLVRRELRHMLASEEFD